MKVETEDVSCKEIKEEEEEEEEEEAWELTNTCKKEKKLMLKYELPKNGFQCLINNHSFTLPNNI